MLISRMAVVFYVFCASIAFSQDDWSESYWQEGCVRTLEPDYQSAINLAGQTAGRYQATCQSQGGTFSWNYRRGFCSPEDPNDLSCRKTCTVHATVYCAMPAVRVQFDGFSESAFVPGANISSFLTLTNLKSQTITGATAEVSVVSGAEFVRLSNATLAWDNIAPSASVKSTAQLGLAMSDAAVCGSEFSLKYVFDTPPYGRYMATRPYRLGHFSGVPVEVKQDGLTTQIGGEGVTTELPIQFTSDTPLAVARKINFSFTAKVNTNTYVRFTLVSPDGRVSKVISEGYANGRFVFDKDLTEAFKQSPVAGNWKFVAKTWGNGVLENFRLLVLPNAYECKK